LKEFKQDAYFPPTAELLRLYNRVSRKFLKTLKPAKGPSLELSSCENDASFIYFRVGED
jgi:hypothetical protein